MAKIQLSGQSGFPGNVVGFDSFDLVIDTLPGGADAEFSADKGSSIATTVSTLEFMVMLRRSLCASAGYLSVSVPASCPGSEIGVAVSKSTHPPFTSRSMARRERG